MNKGEEALIRELMHKPGQKIAELSNALEIPQNVMEGLIAKLESERKIYSISLSSAYTIKAARWFASSRTIIELGTRDFLDSEDPPYIAREFAAARKLDFSERDAWTIAKKQAREKK